MQTDEAPQLVAMPDQLAADDPVVLGVGAPADRGQAPRAEAGEQGGIGENRIHAGGESGGVSGEAMICAARVLAYEHHRRATGCGGEAALQCNADPELPVLSIGERREEASGRAYRFGAHQQVPAVGEQVAHQQPLEDVAEWRGVDGACADECICAAGGDRGRRGVEGIGKSGQGVRRQPVVRVEEEGGMPPLPAPLPQGEGENPAMQLRHAEISRCRHAGIRLTHEPNAGISESCDGVGGPVCRSVTDAIASLIQAAAL